MNESDPRRRRNPSRVDWGTLVLVIIAINLLGLIIVFMGRGPARPLDGPNAYPEPVIERLSPQTDEEPLIEPVTELGEPETPEEESVDEAPHVPLEEAIETSTVRLFFIRVSDEGTISIKGILRPIPTTGSPLTAAINALLDGPRPGELSADVLSLIPEGSRLLGARVEGNIAFLDFNEQFRFNALGIEGYRAQAEQVVFTATEFPTVDKVQFLVEGQRIEYLGGEGFWVGAPLGREDF